MSEPAVRDVTVFVPAFVLGDSPRDVVLCCPSGECVTPEERIDPRLSRPIENRSVPSDRIEAAVNGVRGGLFTVFEDLVAGGSKIRWTAPVHVRVRIRAGVETPVWPYFPGQVFTSPDESRWRKTLEVFPRMVCCAGDPDHIAGSGLWCVMTEDFEAVREQWVRFGMSPTWFLQPR